MESLFLATRRFGLPLWLRCGNRYRIVIRGLKTAPQPLDGAPAAAAAAAQNVELFVVECKTSVEFRAGPGSRTLNKYIPIFLDSWTLAAKLTTFDSVQLLGQMFSVEEILVAICLSVTSS